MNDRKLKEVKEWLEYINQPFIPGMLVQSFKAPGIMAPTNASGVGDYVAKAAAAATPGTAPGSIFEGMQTVANLCRVKANYNPLDVEGNGNFAHFLQFTQNIADVPFLSLLNSSSQEIEQKSKNSDILINSFVDGFVGLAEEDKDAVTNSVKTLAKAALSYAGQVETGSNFAQNLLQTNSSGDVQFSLFNSIFTIKSENNKGTITFESSYKLYRAVYQLSAASWAEIKPVFDQQQKTDTSEWLKNMTTKPKGLGAATTPCLD